MAISLAHRTAAAGDSGAGSGRRDLSEINIVPLVDVVLVLLIIFMLTAHVMEFGLEVERPAGETGPRHGRRSSGGQHHTRRPALSERAQAVNINTSPRKYPAGNSRTPQGVYVRADSATRSGT